jgi:GWxTD domain-containing protein
MKIVCAVLVPLAASFVVAQASTSIQASTPLPAIYQKWVDEEVAYIIAPEERQALIALKSDSERDEFVRQFWLRRDPTPGTEQNEFKEEHYRRIAYSNVHFASKQPGWKTDRGCVYIVQGPPDEITAGKSSTGAQREIWKYLKSDDSAVFEDHCKCGEYEQVK